MHFDIDFRNYLEEHSYLTLFLKHFMSYKRTKNDNEFL